MEKKKWKRYRKVSDETCAPETCAPDKKSRKFFDGPTPSEVSDTKESIGSGVMTPGTPVETMRIPTKTVETCTEPMKIPTETIETCKEPIGISTPSIGPPVDIPQQVKIRLNSIPLTSTAKESPDPTLMEFISSEPFSQRLFHSRCRKARLRHHQSCLSYRSAIKLGSRCNYLCGKCHLYKYGSTQNSPLTPLEQECEFDSIHLRNLSQLPRELIEMIASYALGVEELPVGSALQIRILCQPFQWSLVFKKQVTDRCVSHKILDVYYQHALPKLQDSCFSSSSVASDLDRTCLSRYQSPPREGESSHSTQQQETKDSLIKASSTIPPEPFVLVPVRPDRGYILSSAKRALSWYRLLSITDHNALFRKSYAWDVQGAHLRTEMVRAKVPPTMDKWAAAYDEVGFLFFECIEQGDLKTVELISDRLEPFLRENRSSENGGRLEHMERRLNRLFTDISKFDALDLPHWIAWLKRTLLLFDYAATDEEDDYVFSHTIHRFHAMRLCDVMGMEGLCLLTRFGFTISKLWGISLGEPKEKPLSWSHPESGLCFVQLFHNHAKDSEVWLKGIFYENLLSPDEHVYAHSQAAWDEFNMSQLFQDHEVYEPSRTSTAHRVLENPVILKWHVTYVPWILKMIFHNNEPRSQKWINAAFSMGWNPTWHIEFHKDIESILSLSSWESLARRYEFESLAEWANQKTRIRIRVINSVHNSPTPHCLSSVLNLGIDLSFDSFHADSISAILSSAFHCMEEDCLVWNQLFQHWPQVQLSNLRNFSW